MRVLLDECVPRPLRNELAGHHVRTVRQMGWMGIQNGDLLRLAEGTFDVFLTVDRNLEYQQNLNSARIAVIVLVAKSNSYQDLQLLMPSVMQTLQAIQAGDLVR